jgi:predicted nucleic acid-binding protein
MKLFVLSDEAVSVGNLLMRYQAVPMSLADACIVKMAEQNPQSMVLTLDSDFRIYRRNKNQTIPIIMPES